MKHKEQKLESKLIGTFLMASSNCHNNMSLSRRDDFISLGYMLVYLYNEALPWEYLKDCTDSCKKWNKAHKIKRKLSSEKLCKGMPIEFTVLLKYASTLEFKDMPDYDFFIKSFKKLRYRHLSSAITGQKHSVSSTKEIALVNYYHLMDKTEVFNFPELKDKRILFIK